MIVARLRLPAELTWLTGDRSEIERRLPAPPSVKDALEAIGVPHTEVDGLVADGRDLRWGDAVPDGVWIETHAVPPAAADESGGGLQPRPLAWCRFICDLHLGTLARLLRMLGLDTRWLTDGDEAAMARAALADDRAVLTRNRRLLKRKSVERGLLLRSDDPDRQAVEVLRRFGCDESSASLLFGRCSACNGRLDEKTLDEVRDLVPPKTARWLDTYYLCRDCGKLFWEGTHVEALQGRLTSIVEAAGGKP